jgi:hypothetical protein
LPKLAGEDPVTRMLVLVEPSTLRRGHPAGSRLGSAREEYPLSGVYTTAIEMRLLCAFFGCTK